MLPSCSGWSSPRRYKIYIMENKTTTVHEPVSRTVEENTYNLI
jgi:hypothetical protein